MVSKENASKCLPWPWRREAVKYGFSTFTPEHVASAFQRFSAILLFPTPGRWPRRLLTQWEQQHIQWTPGSEFLRKRMWMLSEQGCLGFCLPDSGLVHPNFFFFLHTYLCTAKSDLCFTAVSLWLYRTTFYQPGLILWCKQPKGLLIEENCCAFWC